MSEQFPVICMNSRPAAGKSEIIQFLLNMDDSERLERYHLGPIHVIDDFPMLWTWLEEDEILEKEFGQPRLHTDPDGYFIHSVLWHLLIRRLNLEYRKYRRDFGDEATVIIEFARGVQHGGYQAAYQHFDPALLQETALFYLNVSFEESLRKNRLRFNPERPDSILEHGLSDMKMERMYRETDWESFSAKNPEYIAIQDLNIPYVVMENEDDVTTHPSDPLLQRLDTSFAILWDRWRRRAV